MCMNMSDNSTRHCGEGEKKKKNPYECANEHAVCIQFAHLHDICVRFNEMTEVSSTGDSQMSHDGR